MKNLMSTAFFVLSVTLLSANSNFFEVSYELFGITNLTDQTLISTVRGDDYFFGIEDNQIVARYRAVNSEVFQEYIPDFSYHDFNKIKEVESITFSNDRDFLYFIAEEDGVDSIYVMDFNEDHTLILRDDLQIKFRGSDSISDLRTFEGFQDNGQIFYSKNNYLKSVYFENDFVIQKYDEEIEVGIEGELFKEFSSYNYDDRYPYLKRLLIVLVDNTYEMWMLGTSNKDIHVNKVKDLTIDEAESLKNEIMVSRLCFTTEDGINKYFFNFNYKDMTSFVVALNLDFLEEGFFDMDDSIVYGIRDKERFLSLSDFSVLDEPDSLNLLDDSIFYYQDGATLEYSDDIFTYSNSETSFSSGIVKDVNWIVLGRYLITYRKDADNMIFNSYIISDDEFLILQSDCSFNVDNIDPGIELNDFIVKFSGSPLYFSLLNNIIFNSEVEPLILHNKMLYRFDDISHIGDGSRF